MITQDRLKELLRYCKDSGVFSWRINRKGGVKSGQCCSCVDSAGYVVIRVDGRLYRGHRLAWLHEHGVFPNELIDHINGIKSDNRILNLRLCTKSQNAQNAKPHIDNTSGFKGVSFCRNTKKWVADICVNGSSHRLGYFVDIEDAKRARASAELELHPFSKATYQAKRLELEKSRG